MEQHIVQKLDARRIHPLDIIQKNNNLRIAKIPAEGPEHIFHMNPVLGGKNPVIRHFFGNKIFQGLQILPLF